MSNRIELPFEEGDRGDLVNGLFICVIKMFWERNVDLAYEGGELAEGGLTPVQKHALMSLTLDEVAKCMPARVARRMVEQRDRLATELLGQIDN